MLSCRLKICKAGYYAPRSFSFSYLFRERRWPDVTSAGQLSVWKCPARYEILFYSARHVSSQPSCWAAANVYIIDVSLAEARGPSTRAQTHRRTRLTSQPRCSHLRSLTQIY